MSSVNAGSSKMKRHFFAKCVNRSSRKKTGTCVKKTYYHQEYDIVLDESIDQELLHLSVSKTNLFKLSSYWSTAKAVFLGF